MTELADVGTGGLLKGVPGAAQPRQEVLAKVEEELAEMRAQLKPALWPIFIPCVNDLYLWRVQLACGCVTEVLTRGKDRFPDDRGYDDHFSRAQLPRGEMWCPADHKTPKPYREIVEWKKRVVRELPADPVEDELGLGAEIWAKIRRTEPRDAAFWQVKLACGHYYDHVSTATDWMPGDAPKLVTPKRAEKMRQELEAAWAKDPVESPDEAIDGDHMRKMVQLCWPRPEPEHDCFTCSRVFRMVGYQRLGWLVPRPRPAKPPQDRRNVIGAQLREAEAEVERLRSQLNELG